MALTANQIAFQSTSVHGYMLFDPAALTFSIHCACLKVHHLMVSDLRFEALNPANPYTWCLMIDSAKIPCGLTIGLNCMIGATDTHQSASHMRALVQHLGTPRKSV